MMEWFSNIYFSLIITGILIIILTVGAKTNSGIIGTMIGYSFIAIGILLVIGFLLNKIAKTNTLFQIIISILPFTVILGSIIYLLYLIGSNFDKIISNHITSNYYTFTNIFVIIIFVQMYILYQGLKDKNFTLNNQLSKVNSMLLLLLGVINMIVVITLGTILVYFSNKFDLE